MELYPSPITKLDSACAICGEAVEAAPEVGVSTFTGVDGAEVFDGALSELSSFLSVVVAVFGSSFAGVDGAAVVDEVDAVALAFFTITTMNFFSSMLYDETTFSSSSIHPVKEQRKLQLIGEQTSDDILGTAARAEENNNNNNLSVSPQEFESYLHRLVSVGQLDSLCPFPFRSSP